MGIGEVGCNSILVISLLSVVEKRVEASALSIMVGSSSGVGSGARVGATGTTASAGEKSTTSAGT